VEEVLHAWVLGEEVKEPEKPPKDASEEDKAKCEQDKATYDHYVYKVEFKPWCVDQCLMQAAGAEFWGPKIKPYYLPRRRSAFWASGTILVPSTRIQDILAHQLRPL
jgi:hypothetical protein